MTQDLAPLARLEKEADGFCLSLSGAWIARAGGLKSAEQAQRLLQEANASAPLRFDTTRLSAWDSALVVFLQSLEHANASAPPARRLTFDVSGLPQAACRLLALADADKQTQDASFPPPSFFERTGLAFYKLCDGFLSFTETLGETLLRTLAIFGGRARMRLCDFLQQLKEAGSDSLIIVSIVSTLIGAILAFVGAVQLKRFGAGIYVADLTGIAMVREMAAVMTAIVMAGRTGGAYAAQLATMQGNEEIDALKVLGIPPVDFLVLPRALALTLMMPVLYIYACACGLVGGLVVAMATLDLSPALFMSQLQGALAGRQFFLGLTKSVVFGAFIALSACHIGLRAGRSAADVGRAATAAVVTGIVGVIVLDALFAVCADALGI